MTHRALLSAACLAATLSSAWAGHPTDGKSSKETVIESEFPFVRGANEAEVNVGAYWTLDTDGSAELPDTAFVLGTVSYGWMLTDVRGDGLCRGNWEFLVDAIGGGIFDGPGDVIFGIGIGLRYNFVRPHPVVVPFAEIGGGGVYSDAANDDGVQRVFGSDFLFQLHGALGLRFMVSDHFAVTLKAEYLHFSNAGLAGRNHGMNGLGGALGVSFFY
jgi:Lipid A 3-O-deacylase (PagL)